MYFQKKQNYFFGIHTAAFCFSVYQSASLHIFSFVVINVKVWPLPSLGRGNQPPSALSSFLLIDYGYRWHWVHWCAQWPRVLHLNQFLFHFLTSETYLRSLAAEPAQWGLWSPLSCCSETFISRLLNTKWWYPTAESVGSQDHLTFCGCQDD